MPRVEMKVAMLTGIVLSMWTANATAGDQIVYRPTKPVPVSYMQPAAQAAPQHAGHPTGNMGGQYSAYDGYPYLNAPMYPSPSPYPPANSGSTVITNQALDPHEMLYPHRYRAMYGPFSYKVNGFWYWTPFGIQSEEHWKLQGTMVDVKYHSEINPLKGFKPKWLR